MTESSINKKKILEQLFVLWECKPKLKLLELINNATGASSKNIDDEALIRTISEYLKKEKQL